ncbi:hypothetical protein HYH02_002107 [Chlamydomonas schloesseri]|uniref:Uncharacterized protein n=1 Tax=Chlamydomonas schloesseri TaxID=2026947 RepID=A0A835WUZ4_9CHLO|nr:hypothetical protein HYH02_002107 [Chlamydomonas schloesseri]|eukprot:KAG2453902.1 hypothetical protein HYH02_002107 [Chlamydomonas schloesseri]
MAKQMLDLERDKGLVDMFSIMRTKVPPRLSKSIQQTEQLVSHPLAQILPTHAQAVPACSKSSMGFYSSASTQSSPTRGADGGENSPEAASRQQQQQPQQQQHSKSLSRASSGPDQGDELALASRSDSIAGLEALAAAGASKQAHQQEQDPSPLHRVPRELLPTTRGVTIGPFAESFSAMSLEPGGVAAGEVGLGSNSSAAASPGLPRPTHPHQHPHLQQPRLDPASPSAMAMLTRGSGGGAGGASGAGAGDGGGLDSPSASALAAAGPLRSLPAPAGAPSSAVSSPVLRTAVSGGLGGAGAAVVGSSSGGGSNNKKRPPHHSMSYSSIQLQAAAAAGGGGLGGAGAPASPLQLPRVGTRATVGGAGGGAGGDAGGGAGGGGGQSVGWQDLPGGGASDLGPFAAAGAAAAASAAGAAGAGSGLQTEASGGGGGGTEAGPFPVLQVISSLRTRLSAASEGALGRHLGRGRGGCTTAASAAAEERMRRLRAMAAEVEAENEAAAAGGDAAAGGPSGGGALEGRGDTGAAAVGVATVAGPSRRESVPCLPSISGLDAAARAASVNRGGRRTDGCENFRSVGGSGCSSGQVSPLPPAVAERRAAAAAATARAAGAPGSPQQQQQTRSYRGTDMSRFAGSGSGSGSGDGDLLDLNDSDFDIAMEAWAYTAQLDPEVLESTLEQRRAVLRLAELRQRLIGGGGAGGGAGAGPGGGGGAAGAAGKGRVAAPSSPSKLQTPKHGGGGAAASNSALDSMAAQLRKLPRIDPDQLRDPAYRKALKARMGRQGALDLYEVVAEAMREMPIADQHKAWRPAK